MNLFKHYSLQLFFPTKTEPTGHPLKPQFFEATTPKTSIFKATGHWTTADRVYIPPRTVL